MLHLNVRRQTRQVTEWTVTRDYRRLWPHCAIDLKAVSNELYCHGMVVHKSPAPVHLSTFYQLVSVDMSVISGLHLHLACLPRLAAD